MRRSTTETKTKHSEKPKEVKREGNDRVTKTEVDVTKVTRKVGFYTKKPVGKLWHGAHGGIKTFLAMLSVATEVKIHNADAAKQQDLSDEMKRIFVSIEHAGRITTKIDRQIKAWNAKANAAAHG